MPSKDRLLPVAMSSIMPLRRSHQSSRRPPAELCAKKLLLAPRFLICSLPSNGKESKRQNYSRHTKVLETASTTAGTLALWIVDGMPAAEAEYTFGDGQIGVALQETPAGLCILHTLPGSQAERLKVPIGSRVLAISGRNVKRLTKDEITTLIAEQPRPLSLRVLPGQFSAGPAATRNATPATIAAGLSSGLAAGEPKRQLQADVARTEAALASARASAEAAKEERRARRDAELRRRAQAQSTPAQPTPAQLVDAVERAAAAVSAAAEKQQALANEVALAVQMASEVVKEAKSPSLGSPQPAYAAPAPPSQLASLASGWAAATEKHAADVWRRASAPCERCAPLSEWPAAAAAHAASWWPAQQVAETIERIGGCHEALRERADAALGVVHSQRTLCTREIEALGQRWSDCSREAEAIGQRWMLCARNATRCLSADAAEQPPPGTRMFDGRLAIDYSFDAAGPFGIVFDRSLDDGPIVVSRVVAHSVASEQGVEAGFELLAVGGHTVRGLDEMVVFRLLASTTRPTMLTLAPAEPPRRMAQQVVSTRLHARSAPMPGEPLVRVVISAVATTAKLVEAAETAAAHEAAAHATAAYEEEPEREEPPEQPARWEDDPDGTGFVRVPGSATAADASPSHAAPAVAVVPEELPLPAGWQEKPSSSFPGRLYYIAPDKTVTWTRPGTEHATAPAPARTAKDVGASLIQANAAAYLKAKRANAARDAAAKREEQAAMLARAIEQREEAAGMPGWIRDPDSTGFVRLPPPPPPKPKPWEHQRPVGVQQEDTDLSAASPSEQADGWLFDGLFGSVFAAGQAAASKALAVAAAATDGHESTVQPPSQGDMLMAAKASNQARKAVTTQRARASSFVGMGPLSLPSPRKPRLQKLSKDWAAISPRSAQLDELSARAASGSDRSVSPRGPTRRLQLLDDFEKKNSDDFKDPMPLVFVKRGMMSLRA